MLAIKSLKWARRGSAINSFSELSISLFSSESWFESFLINKFAASSSDSWLKTCFVNLFEFQIIWLICEEFNWFLVSSIREYVLLNYLI